MSVLQILMNVWNMFLCARKTLSASTYRVHSFAQVGSDRLGRFPAEIQAYI